MRLVIQRVKQASVSIDNKVYSRIDKGLLIFIGININDKKEDVYYLVKKLINMRIFNDNHHKLNLSAKDLNMSLMLISQFTLYANCKKGNRPSFINAAQPDIAKPLYEFFIKEIQKYNLNFKTGKFGAMMDIHLTNNGPATFILDSKN